MKTIHRIFIFVFLISGILIFSSYADQDDTDKKDSEKMCRKMMKGMSHNPDMDQCKNMMRTFLSPNCPSSIIIMKEQLELSDAQVKKLKDIKETANTEAKKVLNKEQTKKLNELTKDRNPQSMMPHNQKTTGDKKTQCPMMQSK